MGQLCGERSLVIPQVTFDNISNAKFIGHEILVSELEEFFVLLLTALENEVGSRVDVGSVPDGGAKDFDVVGSDSVREGENLADSFRNGDLYASRAVSGD